MLAYYHFKMCSGIESNQFFGFAAQFLQHNMLHVLLSELLVKDFQRFYVRRPSGGNHLSSVLRNAVVEP